MSTHAQARGDYAPRARRGQFGREDWYRLTPEQRSLAKIDWCKLAIQRDRYNVALKKRLARLERLHGQRTLLGWEWLMDHPEHELSPLNKEFQAGFPGWLTA